MVVEIKRTDTPEEIEQKLKAINSATANKQQESDENRAQRFERYFGKWHSDIDPLTLQKKWRDEWD